MNNNIQARVKLPQNIQALVGEIGEKQVLLRLSILVHQTDWSVFHNLGEVGYDLLVMNSKTGERIRLEVKTRQKLYTTGKGKHQVQFFLTDGEHQACDFLIAYYLDRNRFYIVPKNELRLVRVVDKVRWRFTLSVDEEGIPHKGKDKFFDAWGSLHPDFTYKDT
jgi:hypothetical protein